MSDSSLDPKTQEAIDAALSADWEKALSLNRELSEKYPQDTETLNRAARAYLELGDVIKAKTNYRKVLKIDPYNSIATKNLNRLENISKASLMGTSTKPENFNPEIFLEEPGKTKILTLEALPRTSILASLSIGDAVEFETKRDGVIVLSTSGKMLGKVSEEWSKGLSEAMRAGSKFVGFVKSVHLKDSSKQSALSIFVKEIERSPDLPQPVFPASSNNFTPYVREETLGLLSDKPLNTELGGGEELEEADSGKEDFDSNHQTSSLETLAEKEITEDHEFEEE
ncbi:MAG: hypothetical protein WD231_03665 [Candidatus Woykebacteria bacterium]